MGKDEGMLIWHELKSNVAQVWRAKVPGGWLIFMETGDRGGLTFYPDPEHVWDGGSRP